jgi:hypothetical protein
MSVRTHVFELGVVDPIDAYSRVLYPDPRNLRARSGIPVIELAQITPLLLGKSNPAAKQKHENQRERSFHLATPGRNLDYPPKA